MAKKIQIMGKKSSRVKWTLKVASPPKGQTLPKGFVLNEVKLKAGKWKNTPKETITAGSNGTFIATRKRAGSLASRGTVKYASGDHGSIIKLDFNALVNYDGRFFATLEQGEEGNNIGSFFTFKTEKSFGNIPELLTKSEVKKNKKLAKKGKKLIEKRGHVLTTTITPRKL